MNRKSAPTNTREQARRDPSLFLAAATIFGASGAIVDQEKEGQKELVNSDTLPTQMGEQDKAALEKWGVKFLGSVPGDDLFQFVELPEGWTKKGSDHDMWSYLCDDKGRQRASIFYKAAFYDRSAHLHVNTRYSTGYDYDAGLPNVEDRAAIPTAVIFRPIAKEYGPASDECQAFLKENFPDKSLTAYWE